MFAVFSNRLWCFAQSLIDVF